MAAEYWSTGGNPRRIAEFDPAEPYIQVSVELWREILTQLGFVKQKNNPYLQAPSSGMTHAASTGEGKSPATHQSGGVGGASETAAGAAPSPQGPPAPAAHERNTK
jgi:hypothetical protein